MDAKKEFEAYVNANQEEQMKAYWPIINVFEAEDTPDPKQFGFEMGWCMALQWIGGLLGVELAEPDPEGKEAIEKIFAEAEKEEE